MKFEVYCDENHPELFTSDKPQANYLMIGSLWLPSSLRDEIKVKVKELREQYNVWGEIKWNKVSPSKIDFYIEIIELFVSYGEKLRFRCIAVDRREFSNKWHNNDNELGFYKFYYQLLHHWIASYNEYNVYCDLKTNRDLHRLKNLKKCLCNANIFSKIENIQALPSKQVTLIQICDLLLGMVSARMNETLNEGSAKHRLVRELEERIGCRLAPTYCSENKLNIFKINLQGGW